jgi:predicted nuclease of predicted toxin-antitoxin system
VAEPIRYYLDEHVPRAVTQGVRRRGGDVLTVQEAGLRGAADGEQLAHAVATGRVVVTQDTDFLRLHADGRAHRGIIYASQYLSVGEIIRGLMLIQDLLTAEEMVNHLEFL